MSKIFDNIEMSFESGLKAILSNLGVKRADFCVGYFNLRGWKLVADDVDALSGADVYEKDVQGHAVKVHRVCRLLIGMHRQPGDLVREMFSADKKIVDNAQAAAWKQSVLSDLRRQLTFGLQTNEDEAALQKLKAQLADGKVVVKLHLRYPLHAKLYLAHRPDDTSNPIMSLMGSSNLTFSGLMRNGELNAEFGDPDDGRKFDKWFTERWNDAFSLDITQDLIKVLDECWASENKPTPYEIYLKIMFNLSREARGGVSEFHLPHPFNTELYEFQKTAVKLVLRHLKKRGGAMLGDVVGLGKTITACAVAKYYESVEGSSALILCPPNLIDMWKSYAREYDLKVEIRSVAKRFDAKRERFFRLVIIDESHNLRNSGGSRYAMIRDLLHYQKNDVLLLTATPYNKDYSDIAAQLRLFLNPDVDLGVRPERAIAAYGGEQGFVQAFPDMPISSIRAFEKSESSDDWRDLLKLFLVRRTRTFIKNNYALSDETDPSRKYLPGKTGGCRNYFPDRIPKTVKFTTKPGDQFESLYCEAMMDLMGSLKLPRYGLVNYLDPAKQASATAADKQIFESLSSAGKRLMGFCRSNFCKRMDSSGVVFLMSLYRHAVRNSMYLYAIKNGFDLPLRVGTELDEGWMEDEVDGESILEFPTLESVYTKRGVDAYEKVKSEGGGGVRWISPTYFKSSLARALKSDLKTIIEMIGKCSVWRPADDEKLNALQKLLEKGHPSEKVLVFTQYSDTARYIATQLKSRGFANVAQVDGDTPDLVEQVCRFSPVSNKVSPLPPTEAQTRILVTTDALSEGQNLQDAHIVVNYDLPWAIIRLIQRAGRVDRIGQRSEKVWCYSFFPQEGVNEIIRLTNRLNARINANAEAVGSDEIFFEGNQQNLADIFNEKAGVLDEKDDGEVDIASQAYQIWDEATKNNPALAKRIMSLADVVYSTKPSEGRGEGVITYARTRNDNDILSWIAADGTVKTQSLTTIFEALACTSKTPALAPLANHHALVARALREISLDTGKASLGVLGGKSTTRWKVFNLLQNRAREDQGTLFEARSKAIANEVFMYPLRESAKVALGKMFARGESADDILHLVEEYHANNELCARPVDEDGSGPRDVARIICSLGLREE